MRPAAKVLSAFFGKLANLSLEPVGGGFRGGQRGGDQVAVAVLHELGTAT